MSKVYIGGCLCGSIRFTASSPNNSHTCSCDICRKHTGAPTVVWIEFDAENVEWTGKAGKPTTWRSSETSCRAFCPHCGSSVGAIDDAPVIALLAGAFDDPNDEDLAPEFHSFSDMQPAWWQKNVTKLVGNAYQACVLLAHLFHRSSAANRFQSHCKSHPAAGHCSLSQTDLQALLQACRAR